MFKKVFDKQICLHTILTIFEMLDKRNFFKLIVKSYVT